MMTEECAMPTEPSLLLQGQNLVAKEAEMDSKTRSSHNSSGNSRLEPPLSVPRACREKGSDG